MNIQQSIQMIAVAILPLLFAITLHEAAHGWIASKLGDKTALMLGRVTLNPVKHIDPIGTVVLPIVMMLLSGFIFGWAKPVPVNWNNLRHPRRDMALVALAGPGANLVMALFWAIIVKASILLTGDFTNPFLKVALVFLRLAGNFGIFINCILLVLNLIPIPPLDGSRVVSSMLPPNAAMVYERIEPYGIWILLLLLVLGVLAKILFPPVLSLVGMIKNLFGLPG